MTRRAIAIRALGDEDAEALQTLVAAVARERRYLGSIAGFTVAQTRDRIGRVRASGGVQFGAWARGSAGRGLVGWIDIMPGPFEGLTHSGRLGMGVAADARGRGIGKALLTHALEAGFATLERIDLDVFASNERAQALYLSVGFVEEGRRRCARKLDGVCDDILTYALLRDEWLTGQAAARRARRR